MLDHEDPFGSLVERPPARPNRTSTRVQKLPSLRERTRAGNREQYSLSSTPHLEIEFRCECARPDCAVRLPLEIERHRRWPERFIVGATHGDGDVVVGVADHFLVVLVNGLTPLRHRSQATGRRARIRAA